LGRPCKPHNRFLWSDSSPEVIQLVVMLYVRYPLSLRNVENPAFERGDRRAFIGASRKE